MQVLPTFLQSRMRGSGCIFELHETANCTDFFPMKFHELSADWKWGASRDKKVTQTLVR
jgi:hypothetical protein